MLAEALNEPEVPLMVTVLDPVRAVVAAVRVTVLVVAVGFVPKAAVTPVGKPEAARVTEPLNGLTSVTVTASTSFSP
jgi:hypothetical protein